MTVLAEEVAQVPDKTNRLWIVSKFGFGSGDGQLQDTILEYTLWGQIKQGTEIELVTWEIWTSKTQALMLTGLVQGWPQHNPILSNINPVQNFMVP